MTLRPEDDIVVLRGGKKRLSRRAYEKELETARRWKREHREQVRESWMVTCECGNRMYRQSDRCRECYDREWQKRRIAIEAMWADGKTTREICEAFGYRFSPALSGVWRAKGLDLPYRRTAQQRANMKAGNPEGFARARAAKGQR